MVGDVHGVNAGGKLGEGLGVVEDTGEIEMVRTQRVGIAAVVVDPQGLIVSPQSTGIATTLPHRGCRTPCRR